MSPKQNRQNRPNCQTRQNCQWSKGVCCHACFPRASSAVFGGGKKLPKLTSCQKRQTPGRKGLHRAEKTCTTYHHRKKIIENFSGLKGKLSRPVVDTKTLQTPRYPPPKSFLCRPLLFSTKRSSALKQGGVWFLFSGCTKGAAKGSCGETVVQKVFLESPFLLCPLKAFS